MADEAALACLLSADAELSQEQSKPPFLVLSHVEASVAEGRIFGPAVVSVDKLQKVADLLFSNGMRQHFVEGREINWFQDARSLRRAAIQRWNKACFGSRSLIEQVQAVRVRAAANVRRTDRDPRDLWQIDRNSSHWVNVVRSVSTKKDRLDPEWTDYKTRVRALATRIDALLLEGLREGRILCSEDLQHGSRFLPPSIASLRSRNVAGSFCFSSDLPEKWFAGPDAEKEKLRLASEWMHRVIDELTKQGKIATARQVIAAAVDKFEVSKDGAKIEWSSVRKKREFSRGSGNFPNESKVKDSVVFDIK
jgi:hypothetical protein